MIAMRVVVLIKIVIMPPVPTLSPAGLTRKDVREEDVSFPAAEHCIFPLVDELGALDEVSHQHIEGLEI